MFYQKKAQCRWNYVKNNFYHKRLNEDGIVKNMLYPERPNENGIMPKICTKNPLLSKEEYQGHFAAEYCNFDKNWFENIM